MDHDNGGVDACRCGFQRPPPSGDGHAERLDRQSFVNHPAPWIQPPFRTPEPTHDTFAHRQQIGRADVDQTLVDRTPQTFPRAGARPVPTGVDMGDAAPYPAHPGEAEHDSRGVRRTHVHDRRPQPPEQQEEGQRKGRAEPAVVHLSPERADFLIKCSRLTGQGTKHQPELTRIEPAHQFDGAQPHTAAIHDTDDVQHRPWLRGGHRCYSR
jgi:hypothetical protein